MKKLTKRINFAIVAIMVSMAPVMAAPAQSNAVQALCNLAAKFNGIFSAIRLLAFIGAGITIAGWAWGYITGGKEVKVVDEVKTKGVALLVGFALLFGLATVLTVFIDMTGEGGSLGCVKNFFK
ncbi:MAG: hypothetical protein IIV74_00645 [Alphaproteobacteria bacterium]|nr:hypothetical protein [Alphaproteobacteria bacterium]